MVLRVPRSAERDAIRAAYRALARLYHPDTATSESAHRQMAAVNRAWAILRDPATRAEFDLASFHRARPSAAGPAGAAPASSTDGGAMPAWMARQAANRRPSGTAGVGAAGPPPGRPSGRVLDFGIYRGWSVGEVERRDPDYLDWLADRPEGLPYRHGIQALQARRPRPPHGLRRPRFGLG